MPQLRRVVSDAELPPNQPAHLAVSPVGTEPLVNLVQPGEDRVDGPLVRHRVVKLHRCHGAHDGVLAAQARGGLSHSNPAWAIASLADSSKALAE